MYWPESRTMSGFPNDAQAVSGAVCPRGLRYSNTTEPRASARAIYSGALTVRNRVGFEALKSAALWRRAALMTVLVAGATIFGCARPQGILFEPIDPPRVWPMPPDTPRIRLIGAISGSGDLRAARSGMEGFLAALRGPRPPIRFSRPHGVAIHEPDLLAVADTAGGAVHVIDLEQRTHRIVSGWQGERFEVPIGVAWAGDRLFVTDAGRGEVIELDAEGRYHHRFGGKILRRPVGITYVPSRRQLYVVDGDAHCIVVFDLGGKFVRTIGRPGVEPGAFNYPTHLCCAGDKLLVADSGNFRVQLLDLDGRCVRTIGQKGNGAGDFALPKGVAFDREGHIYVVDAHFENIQVFNEQGRLLMAFGREGRGAGRFSLPAGLTIDARDRIWVADSGNRRLQVFAYLRTAS